MLNPINHNYNYMSNKTLSSSSKLRKTPKLFNITEEANIHYPVCNPTYNKSTSGYTQTKVRGSSRSNPKSIRMTIS